MVGADGVAHEPRAAQVDVDVAPDLELQMGEAGGERLTRAVWKRVLRIADPPRRRRVRREALREEGRFAVRLRRLVAAEDFECLAARECVLDVAEVDARDELLRRHVDEQLPERLALELRVQIPDRIDDRRGREMDDAFLRTEPAQLRVGDEAAPQSSEVCDELVDGRADDVGRERVDGGDADLRAPADREREPVAGEAARIVRLERDVGGGVVRIGVHRVRARAAARRREPNVVCDRPHDPNRHQRMFLNERSDVCQPARA